MSIKGTLETFNLRELLQTLSFNQKAGTLVLETAEGRRTMFVDSLGVAFVSGDESATRALLRVVRRHNLVPDDRLERALQIHERSGAFLGSIFADLGALDEATLWEACREALGDSFFELQLTSIERFEFAEGVALSPDGSEAEPLEPKLGVEGLLLDLTRKMDHWTALKDAVPSMEEVFEGTGIDVELDEGIDGEPIDGAMAEKVMPCLDGFTDLRGVVEKSNVDPLTVVQIVAAMSLAGGLKPVETADLIARGQDLIGRGDAVGALRLLRSAVDRDDAPEDARLHLADALQNVGENESAAAELDRFAALGREVEPERVFDALYRAMELKSDDAVACGRLCDYYLKHRPWLPDRSEQAAAALRQLIHVAVSARRPLEAADRLDEFIRHGDAPGEDLLVLADLYGAGGRKDAAADALARRADYLLEKGRTAPARDLLRRALQFDPSRQETRTRLHALLGEDRRRARKRRLVVFALLVLLTTGTAGTAWWMYNQRAGETLQGLRTTAESSVSSARLKSDNLLSAFRGRVESAATAENRDEDLKGMGDRIVEEVRKASDDAEPPIQALADALDRFTATSYRDTNARALDQLREERVAILDDTRAAVDAVDAASRTALAMGEAAHAAGRFAEARRQLIKARNTALTSVEVVGRAEQRLRHVDAYRKRFEEWAQRIKTLRDSGDVPATYLEVVRMLQEMLDSDLTRSVPVPVSVESEPSGASVYLGRADTGLRTPCILEYSPFAETTLGLRLPGREPQAVQLPAYEGIKSSPATARAWSPRVAVDLPAGPYWKLRSVASAFDAMWRSDDSVMVLTEGGLAYHPVNVQDARLGPRRPFQREAPVRLAGDLQNVADWRILGHRTLVVRPRAGGHPWETQALGKLSHAPTHIADVIFLVDELGTIYGIDLHSGAERWRRDLGAPPAQPPLAGAGAAVVTTRDGFAYRITTDGQVKRLAVEGEKTRFALPLGDHTLALGRGENGLQVVGPEGVARVVGAAAPNEKPLPHVTPGGVAWLEGGEARWMAVGAEAPVTLTALGDGLERLGGSHDELYASTRDGRLVAVAPDAPGVLRWEAPVGGRATAGPLAVQDVVVLLVDGALIAFTR